MTWHLRGDGEQIDPPGGEDATVWSWTLAKDERSGEERTVLVFISGTAMSSADVPQLVDWARQSKGQTAVQRVLDWDEPPTRITFVSHSREPTYEGGDPGAEVREVNEIADWFDRQGFLLIYGHRTSGAGPSASGINHSVHIVDPEGDRVIRTVEGRSRLEAARYARDTWPGVPREVEGEQDQPKSLLGGGISADHLATVRRHGIHLSWNLPSEDDPESLFLVVAYNDDDKPIAIAVAEDAQDALLAIIEDLLPPDER